LDSPNFYLAVSIEIKGLASKKSGNLYSFQTVSADLKCCVALCYFPRSMSHWAQATHAISPKFSARIVANMPILDVRAALAAPVENRR
jgi:hypothetical protein